MQRRGSTRRSVMGLLVATLFTLLGGTTAAAAPEDDLRGLDSYVDQAYAAVLAGDLAQAQSAYAAYDRGWLEIEDGVKARSRPAYRAIEDAKIALSTQKSSSIEFHRPHLDISVPVTRGEFEELIAGPMRTIREEILKALEIAEIGPEEVSLVLRTGGSSSIPAFVQILEGIFDPSTVQERPVYTTVVHGLASYAQELWT